MDWREFWVEIRDDEPRKVDLICIMEKCLKSLFTDWASRSRKIDVQRVVTPTRDRKTRRSGVGVQRIVPLIRIVEPGRSRDDTVLER